MFQCRTVTAKAWICAASLAAAATGAFGQELSKAAKIEELMQLTKMDQLQQQMMEQIRSSTASQIAQSNATGEAKADLEAIQAKILAMAADRLSWKNLKPDYIKLYDETFSLAEIDGMLSFYKSPAGQAALEKLPGLMGKSTTLAQERMAGMGPEIKKLTDEFAQKHQVK